MDHGAVWLSRRGEARVHAGHPWVFRSDVVRAEGAQPGGIVRVHGSHDRPLGFAFHSSRSEIRLRMVSREDALPDDFLRRRLAAAVAWRETVAPGTDAYRVVHGEGDGIPSRSASWTWYEHEQVTRHPPGRRIFSARRLISL